MHQRNKKSFNKKNTFLSIFLFLLFSGIFFHIALGDSSLLAYAQQTPPKPADESGFFASVLKNILYAIWYVISLLLTAAVTLFTYIIRPDHFAQMFNLASVYELWKFVRDFFNLFFILVLLFIAFCTIFQVEKYHYKKIMLNLVLMALLVNFSFPISRFLIDVTNVPMYFFANQVSELSNSGGLSTFFSASKMGDLLIPKGASSHFANLFLAIIFTFLLAISFVVLAVLMLVRVIALLLLVIFSSVGFACSFIPGMEGYSGKWWDSFWQYALFGPAAMFMMLVSVRFLTEINADTVIFGSIQGVAANATSTSASATYITSMTMYAIPIILLWFTIGLANKFSIAGAGSVTGAGQKFATWAGKKTSGYSYGKRQYEAFASARKKRTEEIQKNSFGGKLGKGLNNVQDRALTKIPFAGKNAEQRLKDRKNKEIYDQAEENKKLGKSDSELRNDLKSPDAVKSAAAAISMADRGLISDATSFARAVEVLGDNSKEVSTVIDKAKGKALDLKPADYETIIKSKAIDGNSQLKDKFDSQIRKEGQGKTLVDYELSQIKGGAAAATPAQIKTAVDNVLSKTKAAKEVAKSESLFTDRVYKADAIAYVNAQGTDRVQAVKKASAEEGTSVGALL